MDCVDELSRGGGVTCKYLTTKKIIIANMANKQNQLPKSRVSELHFEIAHKVVLILP